MSESVEGCSVISVNALKVKLLEEQKELQQLRLDVEKYQDELKVETEKRAGVSVAQSNPLTTPSPFICFQEKHALH